MGIYIVGLTGPTGAGKSAVADVLKDRGLPVINADRLSRRVVEPGMPTLALLAEAFGADIRLPDGSLDRKKLAERAFVSPEQTARLNAIVHPPVIALSKELLAEWERDGERAAVIDAPLLFESGMDRLCALTVTVLASKETRLARIRERDRLTEEQALTRMAAQPEDAYYEARAGLILRNDGDLDALDGAAASLAVRVREAAYGG